MGFGQTSEVKEIQGQIVGQSASGEGVNIINNNTQYTAVTDVNGIFSIAVKEGDVLVFSAVNLEPVRYRITAEDVKSNSLKIKMTANEIELKEVIVNENADITTEKLGIVPKGQKTYTPAERKLATAGDFKPKMLLTLLGGSMPLDPLINKINGRTKKLKKDLKVENKENGITQLGILFEDTYFLETLKIPSEHIMGFKFYVVENEQAILFLKEKKRMELEYLLNDLCLKYNEIVASENK
ncbi:hypothetical protein GON26_12965 [Flavobacterium sp. GA093]|uniref:CarboxypepD_reg-like domain-containing protein n=2 Tax=Flavobacterium hydrocarbonoxydans TaxID=2683249 RepID=A0A6I4NW64_9FLAO|nr:hypothetical protein [Flavobacterium hydrocarbonoxydans]